MQRLRIRSRGKLSIIEFILSTISSWWAVVLFSVPHMFDRQPDTYAYFSKIASERQWAIVFLLAALVKIVGMFIKNASLRRIGLIMSAMIYFFIAFNYLLGISWLTIGSGTFFALGIMAIWGIREVGRPND